MKYFLLLFFLSAGLCAAAEPDHSPDLERIYVEADRQKAMAALEKNQPGWDSGNVIHDANSILGLVALTEGAVEKAKEYLLKAGATPGSPQLNSFGPPMLLARRLVEKGESKVVLEYLDLVGKFWAPVQIDPEKLVRADPAMRALLESNKSQHADELADFKAQVLQGKVPDSWLWRRAPHIF